MSAVRSGPRGSPDLVDLICRAVAAGDGPVLEVLLTILESVADDDMLDRLTAAMAPGTPAAGAAAARPSCQ
ncbi:hypothetical protein CFP65_0973 [Kitasatospora sp. MMS16-BH015]|uniref:hypothetical protein n=1 Tax=Kitasatospora sp. MMS16-BH015 TaxID=2018025 RepID=UPI000CA164F3|nr:hypothetical protein [Kitasatospora sp. MMS16-BH015]AUG75892.1 hypothetical protein CFP65_0973 [Kitasatospora sp. MMS16-BH015]